MTKIFTENDLIRYIYGETNEEESAAIEHAVLCDAELSEQLNNLSAICQGLDNLIVDPSERALDKIFNYSLI